MGNRTLMPLAGLLILALFHAKAFGQWTWPDPEYPRGPGPDYLVRSLARQGAAGMIVAGGFSNVAGITQPFLARVRHDGALDTAFSPVLNAAPSRVQVFPDLRILISGGFTNVNGVFRPGLAVLLPNGQIDPGFVPPPVPSLDSQFYGMSSPDDCVWIQGSFTNGPSLPWNKIGRLLPDGAVDPAFNSPFSPNDSPVLVAVQSDGKAIVSGNFAALNAGVVRLHTNGAVDTSFNWALGRTARISRGALQPDGRLVGSLQTNTESGFIASSPRLFRFHTDGSIDLGFNALPEGPGFPWSATVLAIEPLPDGKLLVGGTFSRINGQPRGRIARLLQDGSPDFCFNAALSGDLTPWAVAVDPLGNVVLGGIFPGSGGVFANNLLRLIPQDCGSAVIEFGTSTVSSRRDAPQVVIPVLRHGGWDREQSVQFVVRDVNTTPGVDYTITNQIVTFRADERSRHIQLILPRSSNLFKTGMLEVALSTASGGAALGSRTNCFVTLLPLPAGSAGVPDTNFAVRLDAPVYGVAVIPGGVYIAGQFTNVNGRFQPDLARLDSQGGLDSAFVRLQRLNGPVHSIVSDRTGRVIAGGSFQRVDGMWRPGLARLNMDGSLDQAYHPFRGYSTNSNEAAEVLSLAILPDDSVLCMAYISPVAGAYKSQIFRITPNGEIDDTFRSPPPLTSYLLQARPGGGYFAMGRGAGASLVALAADGSLDLSFLPPADRDFTPYLGKAGVLPDGRVMVAGLASLQFGILGLEPLWRLNTDGSHDTGFALRSAGSLGPLQMVDCLSVSRAGSVLVAGAFERVSGGRSLMRFHPDGSPDLGFDPGKGILPTASGYARAYALEETSDGGWLLAGEFGGVDDFKQPYLVRLLPESGLRPRTIAMVATNMSLAETNLVIPIEVVRRGDSTGLASVRVRTVDGTATGGQDFEPFDVTLAFQAGEWAKTILLRLWDDSIVESNEQFTVEMLNPPSGGYSLESPSQVTVTLLNNDAGVEFTADQFSALEEDGFAYITTFWSGAANTQAIARLNIIPVVGQSADLAVSTVSLRREPTNYVRIPITENARPDGLRVFDLELVAESSAQTGPRRRAQLLLRDADYETTPARGVAGVVASLAPAPHGGVYLAGDFTGVHGVARNGIARLYPDGEVDTRFNPGAGPDSDVSAIAVQPDGRVLLAGSFTSISGVPRAGLARLNEDGSLDTSFLPGTGIITTNSNAFISTLVVLPNRNIMVAGRFTHFDGFYSKLLTLLDSAGRPVPGFQSPFLVRPWGLYPFPAPDADVVRDFILQSDGSFIAAGSMTVPPGVGVSIASLGADGAYDVTFPVLRISAMALACMPDGSFLVGSRSTTNLIPVQRLSPRGVLDPAFQSFLTLPAPYNSAEIRQLRLAPDRKILFAATLNVGSPRVDTPAAAMVGRLLNDGRLDPAFHLLECRWPSNVAETVVLPSLVPRALVPTASFVLQPNGILVIGGAFDAVNGEPRRRLARADNDGQLRGLLHLRLLNSPVLRLLLPDEAEVPYRVETSTDLSHWVPWLENQYPWWGAEVAIPGTGPVRFFRVGP